LRLATALPVSSVPPPSDAVEPDPSNIFDRWVAMLCVLLLGGWMLAACVALVPVLGVDVSGMFRPAASGWAPGEVAWLALLTLHGFALCLVLAHLWRLPRLSGRRKLLWLAGLTSSGPVAMSLYWALHMRRLHRRPEPRGWPDAEFMPSGHPVTQAD
jgi:hypothetical protein